MTPSSGQEKGPDEPPWRAAKQQSMTDADWRPYDVVVEHKRTGRRYRVFGECNWNAPDNPEHTATGSAAEAHGYGLTEMYDEETLAAFETISVEEADPDEEPRVERLGTANA